MRLSLLTFTSLALVATASFVPPWDISRVDRRADGYTQDLFTGTELQEGDASKPSSSLQYTTGEGAVFPSPFQAQRIGQDGPLLLQDFHMIENLAHFVRERVPERVVHARGSGAHGYFQLTTDFASQYSMADVFQRVGEKTPITMRFSTVGGEAGSADTARDPRGFSIKMRTKKGILDWVFNNTPVFFIRDPLKFPEFIHTQKRDPQTGLKNHDMFWDYLSSNPESLYQVMRLFSDLGTPYSLRTMSGWSGHTYRLVKADGSWVYVKVSCITDQGVQNYTNAEAAEIAGTNPDIHRQDLWDNIAAANYPSWTVYFQVMTPQQAQSFKYSVLDLTKDWDVADVPAHEVGKLVLTQNPDNYFAEIEQASFSPSNMVPGWEPSTDPVLQSRLFSYPDAARYRIGPNYQQIPVNCPFASVANFQRDGPMNVHGNQGSRPNYPSTIDPLGFAPSAYDDANSTVWTGGATRYLSTISDIDFEWPSIFWGNMSKTDQDNFVSNVVGHLGQVKSSDIRKRQAQVFARANQDLGNRIAQGVNVTLS